VVKKSIKELRGTEILARHVLSDGGIELIAQGTELKTEYIEKLEELDIEYVYIEEKAEISVQDVCEKTKDEVKDILEKHIYKNDSDLVEICRVADDIISDVINEEELMEQIATIRHTVEDLYTHSVNVCTLATVLALKNHMADDVVKDIARGSLLHDIGLRYITVPYENVDAENMGGINQAEYKKHPIYGFDAVRDAEWLSELTKEIILFHHERMDGSGYSLKYSREDLKDPVLIVSVCDAFDEMIGGIGYKQRSNYEVIEYLRDNSDIKFHKKYIAQLLEMAAMYPAGIKVQLSTGESAVVKRQNKGYIDRPVVDVVDEDGNLLREVDLLKELTVFITKSE